MKPLCLCIGPLTITLSALTPDCTRRIRKRYHHFLCATTRGTIYPVTMLARNAHPRTRTLTVSSTAHVHTITRHDFLSISDDRFAHTTLACIDNDYAFDSWLRIFITLIGSTQGILLIHGAGTHFKSKAYLFPGVSGKGKSTITRLLGTRAALSDEITMLSVRNNGIVAYSTPFWGELARPGNNTVVRKPLKHLYFLRHGNTLHTSCVDRGTALTRLMRTILFFSPDAKLADGMMTSAAQLVTRVPASLLTFSLHTTRTELHQLLGGSHP